MKKIKDNKFSKIARIVRDLVNEKTFYTLANNCLLYKKHLDIGPFLRSDWRLSKPENKFPNSASFSKEHLKARSKSRLHELFQRQKKDSTIYKPTAVVQVGVTRNKLSSCEVLECV